MATTPNKGFLKHTQASGTAFANVLRSLVTDLDGLLRGRETEEHTLSDGDKAALLGGNTPDVVLTVVNVDDNTSALVHLAGSGNAVNILAQSGSSFGTTEGNDTTTNIYWDSGNSRYEINNEKGGDRTYNVTAEGAE